MSNTEIGRGPAIRLGAPGSAPSDANVQSSQDHRADAIAAAIRQAVVEHRLPPGTKLPEDQVGALFGVSRTLVRAALQRLAHDNIVVLARNRGAAVASPSVAEARQLFDARRVVEGALVRRAAGHLRADDGTTLARLIERGERAVRDGDRGAAIRLSGEFHLAVADVARQPVLRAFLAELTSRTSLVIALYGRSRASDCGVEEHRALLDALLAGDAGAAEALMLHHLAHIEDDLDLAEVARAPVTLAGALRGLVGPS